MDEMLSATPRGSSADRSKTDTKTELAKDNSAIWIGGGIGLLAVAILAIGGVLLLAGLPGGNAKTTAQSLKAGETKKKPMKEKGAVEEESAEFFGLAADEDVVERAEVWEGDGFLMNDGDAGGFA